MSVPNVVLNNGIEIPQLGFGVWRVPSEETQEVVELALEAGYRHIDTAKLYGNEDGVGAAIRASGLDRDQVFVTSKVWNDDQGYDATLRAFETTMRELKFDVLDLYLIHWPVPSQDAYVDTWKAFQEIYKSGRAKAIGVSNFQIPHLRRLFDETDIVPALNQIELHPNLPQADLRAFHTEHDIITEAWSPLGRNNGLLDSATVANLAEKYGKTPAQIVLRWHIELGNVTIPKSVTPSRIKENIEVFDFELAQDDVKALTALETGVRVGPNPDDM